MVTFEGRPRPDLINPIDESITNFINQQTDARRSQYDLARRYYEGDHNVPLTDRLKAYLRQSGLEFADNFCELVVDALAERLRVIGFSGANDQLNEYAWDVWQQNRIDQVQHVVHIETAMLGDTYVLVDWDNERERPRITMQPAEMIIPHYNEAIGGIDWLSKRWVEGGRGEGKTTTRLNLYYPDRIEKYIAAGGIWRQHMDEGENVWPIPWIDDAGEPLGVTMIHFRNKLTSDNFGTSEIANVIPMQDALNKSVIDLLLVLDTMAFGQRYSVDIVNPGTLDAVPGSIINFHSEEETQGVIGEWTPSDPTGMIRAIEILVQHIAGVSRTPQHLFQISGGAPSGESLKMAESGLVNKAKSRMVHLGNSWEDVIMMAAKLENTFGSQTLDIETPLTAEWDDPESRNEEQHLMGLETKQRLGVPQRQIWREMGYTADQIEQMEQDIQDQRVATTNIGAAILESFSRGEGA